MCFYVNHSFYMYIFNIVFLDFSCFEFLHADLLYVSFSVVIVLFVYVYFMFLLCLSSFPFRILLNLYLCMVLFMPLNGFRYYSFSSFFSFFHFYVISFLLNNIYLNIRHKDTSWRIAQYVTYKRLPPESLSRRAAAWRACIRTGLVPSDMAGNSKNTSYEYDIDSSFIHMDIRQTLIVKHLIPHTFPCYRLYEVPSAFASGFSPEEQARLGMASAAEDAQPLEQAIAEGAALTQEALEAVLKLRRAYRLKQSAIEPSELQEAGRLFREAFAANPELKAPLQRVGQAEDSYLPFWIL